MLNKFNLGDPVLINTIGHTAGILLFGLIILLIIRDWRDHGIRQTKLSLLAALLALGWNVGSLVALGAGNQDSVFISTVMTASFAILSLLPAVLLQVALQGADPSVVTAGYFISMAAVALHVGELASKSILLHHAALVVIALGFALLTALAFLVRRRRMSDRAGELSEYLVFGALLVFAGSFVHFGYDHVSSPWTVEIAWHHIGIPVVLIVLLQDYRFLLLDTFIRFLSNAGLAALYIAAVFAIAQRLRLWQVMAGSMFACGIALVFLCLSLVLFAHLRNRMQLWVSRAVFRRQNIDICISNIVKLASQAPSEQALFTHAARTVAAHLRAEQFVILDEPMSTRRPEIPSMLFGEGPGSATHREHFRTEAQIPLRFSSGDTKYLVAGARRGGQRYLSEELEDMRRLGSVIVEQIERFRAEELRRLVSQAELRALQAQINPHFLFNALNTLYGSISRQSQEARRLVLNLAEIFRYLLQSDRAMIELSEELRIVKAYLEIEVLRLGDRLETELQVSESARSMLIPVLSIQPLIENAVKHGVAAKSGRGRVCLKAERTPAGLVVSVEDTGIGFERSAQHARERAGVGLENVRRRLMLSYGKSSELQIQSSEAGTTVSFFIPDLAAQPQAAVRTEVPA